MEDIYTLEPKFLAASLDGFVPAAAKVLAFEDHQKAIPALAKDPAMVQ